MAFFWDGGFGDPVDAPSQLDEFEAGFGNNEGVGPGFGDKEEPSIQSPVLVGAQDFHALFHDEGGEVVRVFADFKKEATLAGYDSFRVRLRGPNGQDTLIPNTGFCYSSVGGGADTIKPTASNTLLEFSLPPLPLGAYEILIYSGDGSHVVWTLSDMILIERRKRDRSTYRTRNRLHQVYLTGPRRLRQEDTWPEQ